MRVLQDPADKDTDTDKDNGKGAGKGTGKGTGKGEGKGRMETGPLRTSPDLKPTLSRPQGKGGRFSSTPGSAMQCSPVRPTD